MDRSNIIMFLINPFLGTINAVKNIRDNKSLRILYFWFLVFGMSYYSLNEGLDSYKYLQQFLVERNYSFAQYARIISDFFSKDSDTKDIYTLTVNFLVGQFTTNYHWTYFIYAGVMGFFYLKSVKYLLRFHVDNNYVFYSLLFIMCISNPIFNITTLRFWTAAWIGVYVTLKCTIDQEYKYALLLILTPLIHGSFYIWIGILVVALFTSKFQKIWIPLYFASTIFSAVSFLNLCEQYVDYLPTFMQHYVWSYIQSERALRIMGGTTEFNSAYADFLNTLPTYFMILLTFILIVNRNSINDTNSKLAFSWYLPTASICNFLSGIPSMGRYQQLTWAILMVIWCMNYNILKKYNKCFYLVPFAFFYIVLYWYRRMCWVCEFDLFILPAPLIPIKYLLLQ